MSLIKLNYELAIAQAAKIENAGNRCSDVRAEVEKQISAIEASWGGESANALIEQLKTWCKEIKEIDSTLNDLAGKVRKKAGEIKAVDEFSETSEGE